MKPISNQKQTDIKALLLQNVAYRHIATRVGVSLGMVAKIARSVGHVATNAKGRPAKLDQTTARMVFKRVETGEYGNAVQAQKWLRTSYGIEVHPQTVRNLLKSNGLHAKKKSNHQQSRRR
jgi:transposase